MDDREKLAAAAGHIRSVLRGLEKKGRKKAEPSPEITKEECGRRLKAARIAAGYDNHHRVGEKLGMAPAAYGDYERGHKAPTWPILHRIIVGLGLDIAILFPEADGNGE